MNIHILLSTTKAGEQVMNNEQLLHLRQQRIAFDFI